MKPRYPIFVPTKGRYAAPYTIRALEQIGVSFHPVVQPQERDAYASIVGDPSQIIVLPHDIDGLVPTRNWIWDYAQKLEVPRFWTFDDNIRAFYRLYQNTFARFTNASFLLAIEDFADRYENLAICGMQYFMFVKRKQKIAPLVLNTRIYSNMLIETNIPYRNRGIYNDDTDLCLRVLKDGLCTAEFQAFLVEKLTTMTVKGGNTPIYQGDGRLKMAQSLKEQHPDVTEIVWKWGRWQHQVDYRPFKANRLKLKEGVTIPQGVNEYGMKLVNKSKTAAKN
jgi:hypothetical protein